MTDITLKTDDELLAIAMPMVDDVVKASNNKDWEAFSMYQTAEEADDPDNKQNVLRQWEQQEFLSSLNTDREVLTILRRDGTASIVWKQTSDKVRDEFLAIYSIREIEGEVKEVGFVIL
ncbi:hypothetical protein [Marinomonas piezotolerans]|nr:hypothetical protein [Marinomonas piezotolerans]